jgi:hypothetical protein
MHHLLGGEGELYGGDARREGDASHSGAAVLLEVCDESDLLPLEAALAGR